MKSVFKSKKVLVVFAIILVIVAVIITAVISIGFSNEARANRKVKSAEKYVTELNYEDAILAYEEAIKLDPRNMDTYLALAEVYVTMGEPEQAIVVLERGITVAKGVYEEEKLILKNCDLLYIRECDLLFELGRKEEALEKAREGLNFIGSPLLEEYFSKVSPSVTSSLPEGKYEKEISIELSTTGTKIYYTTDGSEPNTTSDVYKEPIKLENGKTIIKAIAESERETLGEVRSFSYSMIYVPQEVKEVVYQLYDAMKADDFDSAFNIIEKNEDLLDSVKSNENSNIKVMYDGTDFVDGMEGIGLVVSESNCVYYGDISNGSANGKGSFANTYKGILRDDGQEYQYRRHESYSGQFVEGLANGEGKFIKDLGFRNGFDESFLLEAVFHKGLYTGKVVGKLYNEGDYLRDFELMVVDGIVDEESNIKNGMGDGNEDGIIFFIISSNRRYGYSYGYDMVNNVDSGWHN